MNKQIIEDLTAAMKAQDKFKMSVLRMLKSAIQMEAIKEKKELTDDEIVKVIKKQVKTRKDSIEEYEKYNKLDTVEDLKKEIEVLSVYLPEELSEEQIISAIDEVFDEIHPTSMKDMGGIMKVLNEKIPSADMSVVSKLVKEKLSWE